MFPIQTKILVVDDMAAMRLRLMNQLKAMGYTNIDQAENGQEAFEVLEKKRSENNAIELVISDWNMPVLSGIDLLEKVRSNIHYAKLPFIMVTAEGEKQQVVRALKIGVSDYLVKPVDKSVLGQKLASLWERNKAAA